MTFPDLPHLKQLQKDLWQWPKSRASIMVGSGFSLNAEPLPGVKKRFATWWELVRSMFDELHPSQPDEAPQEREARFNRASPLRVASEYEAAFGRRKLDHLIRSEIPNSDYQPGGLHHLLLQLPWADVFTTNYDTLLERTEVDARTYQPVIKASELTTAFAPRIIKLHGSFPSETPFIITEEDYRTYPRCFAPFVNSVQQSLLENSVALIGFSGEDPNFLAWTGWIRDELGGNHAPIYLVGPLSLGNAERSLLARRGVTPVDLSPVFAGHPPDGLHTAAIRWFLNSLAAGRPSRPEKWPNFQRISVPSSHPPIAELEPEIPETVPLSPDFRKPLAPEMFARLMRRWQFERSKYPGWVVAQQEKRSGLWLRTRYWVEPVFSFAENLPAVDRILVFREFIWRLELSMVPLFVQWIEPLQKALDDLVDDVATGRLLRPSLAFNAHGRAVESEIAGAWLEVAFSLLRDARESYEATRWAALKAKIDRVVEQHQRYADRNHYEEALWAMWNVEREPAKAVLARWQPSYSPLARMWKAGLLAELDEITEAKTILRTALAEIRRALRNQGQSRELLSLEGWCTYLIHAVELSLDFGGLAGVRDEFWERWEELKAWDCSPWPYKEYFDEALSAVPPKLQKQVQEVRGFDPEQVTVSLRLSGDEIEPFLPGFAYIRLFEQVGIPMHLPNVRIAGECLKNACIWVSPVSGFLGPTLLIRSGKLDFLSRPYVASMEPAFARRLHAWCLQIVTREVAAATGLIARSSSQELLLEVYPEVLSRLALKVEPAELRKCFPLALRYHRLPAARLHMGMHEACMNWFKRLFKAADNELLMEWLPDLIREPLFDDARHPALQTEQAWPDPVRYFPTHQLRIARGSHSDQVSKINDATEWLLRRAASESGVGRRWAMLRLIAIYDTELMTPDHRQQMAELLWSRRSDDGLPALAGLTASGLLGLPSPPGIDVPLLVKSHILNLTSAGAVNRGPNGSVAVRSGGADPPLLREAAHASKPVVQLATEPLGSIEWTQDEANQLFEKVLAWWANDKTVFEIEGGVPNMADPVLRSLEILNQFLARVVLPRMDSADESEWRKLVVLLEEIRTAGGFPTPALPYVLLHRPGDSVTIAATITCDLYSDVKDAVGSAARAVRHWIHLSTSGKVAPPPPAVMAALIERVVFRRNPGVTSMPSRVSLPDRGKV